MLMPLLYLSFSCVKTSKLQNADFFSYIVCILFPPTVYLMVLCLFTTNSCCNLLGVVKNCCDFIFKSCCLFFSFELCDVPLYSIFA